MSVHHLCTSSNAQISQDAANKLQQTGGSQTDHILFLSQLNDTDWKVQAKRSFSGVSSDASCAPSAAHLLSAVGHLYAVVRYPKHVTPSSVQNRSLLGSSVCPHACTLPARTKLRLRDDWRPVVVNFRSFSFLADCSSLTKEQGQMWKSYNACGIYNANHTCIGN